MEHFWILNSEVKVADTTKLKSLLSSIEEDLSISYLHTRPNFEDNLRLQIEHSLNQVISRERDLKTLIGISKILLTSYSELRQQYDPLIQLNKELLKKQEKLTSKQMKLQKFKEKYYETVFVLEEAETKIKSLSLKLKEIHSHPSNISQDSISLERFSSEITNIYNKFREDYDKALKDKFTAEQRCAELETELNEKTRKLSAIKIERKRSMRISTDIDSYDISRLSLKASDSVRFDLKSDKWNESRLSFSKNFEVCKGEQVLVEGQAKKFEQEIYFLMTLNVVKMNNEALCGVNVDYHEMYLAAIEKGVPLHKWSFWIESQLSLINMKPGPKKRRP